jgi:adenine-specific DNA-methyltransferase
MIYIDPPYNTGGEFIYPDNYKEGLADYLKFSGQVSGDGIRLTTNAETDGRYHSKWLTMMYPRLFLARNLLREDGVIFVSIDDHEVHNLRAVMNEIFGEENFVAQLVWDRNRKNDARYFSVGHEYMLVYFRNEFRMAEQETILRLAKEGVDEVKNLFNEYRQKHGSNWAEVQRDLGVFFDSVPAEDPRHRLTRFNKVDGKGPYRDDGNINWPGGGGPRYEVIHPVTNKPCKIPTSGWRYPTHERFQEEVAKGRIVFGPDETTVPRVRTNLFESTTQVMGSVNYSYAQTATNQFAALFDGKRVFENPKPVDDLKTLAAYTTGSDDLILDFFAGSGTTAQAVLELNEQDGGNRKFILIQLPEPTGRKDFPTITDITKERVRRVVKRLSVAVAEKQDAAASQLKLGGTAPVRELDLGFKVFKLSSSNFKVWDAATAPKDGAALAEQLKLAANNVENGRPDDALLYELALKSNLPLTSKITASKIGEQSFYDVADGALVICLARKLTQETLRGLMARTPKSVICLDIAFVGNDQLKANTVLEMKSHGIEFHTA